MFDDYKFEDVFSGDYAHIIYNIAYGVGALWDRSWEAAMVLYLYVGKGDELDSTEWEYFGALFGKIFYEIWQPKTYEKLTVTYPDEITVTD